MAASETTDLIAAAKSQSGFLSRTSNFTDYIGMLVVYKQVMLTAHESRSTPYWISVKSSLISV